jgi:hypothetical protein
MNPNHKEYSKLLIEKLNKWKEEPINKLRYLNNFKYIPTVPIMQLIVLRAAL